MNLLLAALLSFNTWALTCQSLFQSPVRAKSEQHKTLTLDIDGTRRNLQMFLPASHQISGVVIYFHGTNSLVNINHPKDAPYGTYYESQLIKKLISKGYVVFAPESNSLPGFVPLTFFPTSYKAWEANIYPYSENFSQSRDVLFVETLLLNFHELTGINQTPPKTFLAGFSSGGYMASRLANMESFAERIDGIIINAASYGTCLGASCSIPQDLPSSHPKTLLLANRDDTVVPFFTVEKYESRLQEAQIPVTTSYNDLGSHSWLPQHVSKIVKWIQSAH